MSFDFHNYVPCVRWKQGEYQAILNLSSITKNLIVPLIEAPEIGFDFETAKNKKTVDEHLVTLADRVMKKWGKHTCFLDLHLIESSQRMADGAHPLQYVFSDLRSKECQAIPVTGLSRDAGYQNEVQKIASNDGRGACLRITIEEAVDSNLKGSIDKCLKILKLQTGDCDLILDLAYPNFEPIEGFCKLVVGVAKAFPYLNLWRSFTVLGTSFPSTMAGLGIGLSIIPRSEWVLYKMLIKKLKEGNLRIPIFGDYVINHPKLQQVDMRKVRPSGTIRYTINDGWAIVKGPNVRDHGFKQFKGHCSSIVNSQHFSGSPFSWGDDYISKCSRGVEGTGNLTIWRRVGTNHHLEKVSRDVSKLHGSANTP